MDQSVGSNQKSSRFAQLIDLLNMPINTPSPQETNASMGQQSPAKEASSTMEDLILTAAESCFLDYGFDKTSTTMIAKQVGCNQALIHYYFRTKLNLFSRIFERKFMTVYTQMTAAPFSNGESFTDKVRLFVETHFDMIHKDPRLARLIVNEIHRMPTLVMEVRSQLSEKPQAMIQRLDAERQTAIDTGEIRPISLMDLAMTALSLNLAPVFMMPILSTVLPLDEPAQQALIAARRQQNVATILHSLRP